jgi:hypothetical protein
MEREELLMGWSFECGRSRLKDYLARMTQDESYEPKEKPGVVHKRVCLAHKYVMNNPGGGRLWTVWEYWDEVSGVAGQKTRFIGYDLIRWGGGGDCGWGNKSMSEESGIGDTTCPLSYLAMVPEPVPCPNSCPKEEFGPNKCQCGGCHGCGRCWAAKWRKNVRGEAAAKERVRGIVKMLKAGDTVHLNDGWKVNGFSSINLYTNGKLPRGITPKMVDFEKTLAARQGIKLEGM